MDIVKIDSPSGEENDVADFIVHYLKDKVDVIKKDAIGNIYTRIEGKGTPLFLAAHMDTVEPGRGIKPQIKEGYITSDGTTILGADNKVAVAGIIETIEQLKEKKILHRPLDILFTTTEETDSSGARGFDYSLLSAKQGYCFDRTDPVGTIVTASPFYERVDLTIHGQEAHASKPEGAINVLSILKELLNTLTIGVIDEDTIVNFGIIKGGFVRNTIPGELYLGGEVRSFVEEKLIKATDQIKDAVETITKKYKATYKIECVIENGGYKFSKDNQFLKQTETIIKQTGFTPNQVVAWGVSDGNTFYTKGLECINLGDGAEFAHEKRERIKIQNFEDLVKLMIALITENI